MELGIYLLQSTLCLGLFYGIYMLLLKNEKGFKANRIYLLLTLVGSFIIPLIQIPIEVIIHPVETFSMSTELVPISQDEEITAVATPSIYQVFLQQLPFILLGIYLLGMLIRLYVFSKNIFTIRRLISSGRKEKIKGVTHIFNPKVNTVFSFMNVIFWGGRPLHETDKKRVLEHELAHIKQGHSYDILLCELIKIPFWFHPLVYWYKNSLQHVHEYLADEAVIKDEGRSSAYATLLVQQAKNYSRVYSICNSLFQQPIKKRLIMMTKSKSGILHSAKMFSITPILFGLIYGICVEYKQVILPTLEITSEIVKLNESTISEKEVVKDTETQVEKIQKDLSNQNPQVENTSAPKVKEDEKTNPISTDNKLGLLENGGALLENGNRYIVIDVDGKKQVVEIAENVEAMNKQHLSKIQAIKASSVSPHTSKLDSIPQNGNTANKGPKNPPQDAKKGACYTKCMMPKTYTKVDRFLPIYTGDGNDDVKWELQHIRIKDSSEEWVKKKMENCKSDKPDECMVWCLVETPMEYKSIKLVLDPNNTPSDKFEMQNIPLKKMLKNGGDSGWFEIICNELVTAELVTKIQKSLNQAKAKIKVNGEFDKPTKKALLKFQKANDLPVGGLNLPTMEALRIEL